MNSIDEITKSLLQHDNIFNVDVERISKSIAYDSRTINSTITHAYQCLIFITNTDESYYSIELNDIYEVMFDGDRYMHCLGIDLDKFRDDFISPNECRFKLNLTEEEKLQYQMLYFS